MVYCLKVTPLSRFVIFEVNIDSHVDPLSVEVIIIEEPCPLKLVLLPTTTNVPFP